MQREKTLKTFDDFTNLYEVPKTLRFELKPVGKTEDLLKQNKVFEKDKLIDDNYHKIKYYFDLLHRKFIKEALSEINFDFSEYYKKLLKLKKNDRTSRVNFESAEKKLREKLAESFNKKANEWKEKKYKNIGLKQNGFEIFFEKDNLEILKEEFKSKPNDDKEAPDIEFIDPLRGETKSLFESFKGFTTYLSNFHNSRRNFYSGEDKDTAVANRAINENLRRFCDNKKLFEDKEGVYEEIGLTQEQKKIFDLNFYNKCLTQNGIKKYNEIIGRRKKDEGSKGLNQKINEYKQRTKKKIQNFKMLDKQILGESNKDAEKFIEISDDAQVFDLLQEFIKLNDSKNNKVKKLFVREFLFNQKDYELNKIYLKKAAINTILGKFFGVNWQYFENALPKKETNSKEEKYKLDDFISIQTIKDALLGIQKDKKDLPKKYLYLNRIVMSPEDLFKKEHAEKLASDNYQSFLNVWRDEFEKCLNEYEIAKKAAEGMIFEEKDYKKSDKQIEKIKAYADASLAIYRMMKYFALEKGSKKVVNLEIDNNFYNSFSEYYSDYHPNTYYDEFRNYLTKKDFLGRLLFPAFGKNREQKHPLSKRKIDGVEKIKLNFDISHDHKWGFLTFLFRQNETEYYLGIPKKGGNFKFNNSDGGGKFEKMDYVQLKFKTLTGKGYIRDFKKKYSKQEDREAIANVKTLIKKQYLFRYPLLSAVLDKKYTSKKEFSKHVNELLDMSYSAIFIPIKEDIFEINNNGGMFLFKLNNKDFRTKGTPNLHTQYFNLLFNRPNPAILKLNSEISLYFRPEIKNLPVREKDGKKITFIDKRDSNKEKDVLQHRRYADDKVFLHLSIIQNFGKERIRNSAKAMKGYAKKFNNEINERMFDKNVNIIGIDRGENNLAYYSIIDRNSKILETKSFNTIDVLNKEGKVVKTVDYLKLLEKKAGNRDESRKNWKTIENIKELKNGYISQIIRKICDLALKYNAIIVFEDLSSGFKRSRMKIERQVYQKLELALVKKLNYLVNKNTPEGKSGHYLRAYQLTSPIANYGNIGKQTGIVFYTQAGYTSKTCPQCGFRKNVGFYFETKQKAEDEIRKLKIFEYEPQNNRFKIEYSLSDFAREERQGKKKRDNLLYQDKPKKDDFVIYSNVVRYKWRNTRIIEKDLRRGEKIYGKTEKGTVLKYDITNCLIGLFKQNGINYRAGDFRDLIVAKNLTAEFYKDLFYYLFLLCNTRNSISNTDIDYIQCPRCGFHSDNPPKELEQIKNGDANGAYNIARKGIMILEKIKKYKDKNGSLEKMNWGDLVIGIDEWDKFTQKDWKGK